MQPLRDVAHAQQEAHAWPAAGAADGNLDRQRLAVAAANLHVLGRRIDERVRDSLGERIERRQRRHERREKTRDVLPDDVRDGRAQQPQGGRIGFLHDAVRGHRQDRILDVVEDRMQNAMPRVRPRLAVTGEDQLELVAH